MIDCGKRTIGEDIKIKNKFIDYAGLFFIGALSLGYLLNYRGFAKLHVNLPLINVPFFIGDMTFTICGLLSFLKWLINRKSFNIFICLFLSYCAFLITKILVGYINWGPLSLRHAVLFCYPLFAVFSYSFYRSEFFKPKLSVFLIAAFIIIFKFFNFYQYFNLTLFMITSVLIYAYPVKPVKYTLFFLLLLVFPYELLFSTSRTFMMANFIALIYIGFGTLYLSKIRSKLKPVFSLLFLLFVFYGLIKESRPNELDSLLRFDGLIKRYNETKEFIRIKEPTFVPLKLNVKLYNQESPGTEKSEKVQVKEFIRIKEPTFVPLKLNVKLYNQESSGTEKSEKVQVKEVKRISPVDLKMAGTSIFASDKNVVGRLSAKYDKIIVTPVIAAKNAEYQPKLSKEPGLKLEGSKNDGIILDSKPGKTGSITPKRCLQTAYFTSIFRILIWEDAFKEIRTKHPIFGFDFGKPFRSPLLEITGNAMGEWTRDGWICLHNSYIDIIYRAGIAGVVLIIFISVILCVLVVNSFRKRSLAGVLLTGTLLNWFIAANFLEILEMPYTAIPLWSLFGLTFAYLFKDKNP